MAETFEQQLARLREIASRGWATDDACDGDGLNHCGLCKTCQPALAELLRRWDALSGPTLVDRYRVRCGYCGYERNCDIAAPLPNELALPQVLAEFSDHHSAHEEAWRVVLMERDRAPLMPSGTRTW